MAWKFNRDTHTLVCDTIEDCLGTIRQHFVDYGTFRVQIGRNSQQQILGIAYPSKFNAPYSVYICDTHPDYLVIGCADLRTYPSKFAIPGCCVLADRNTLLLNKKYASYANALISMLFWLDPNKLEIVTNANSRLIHVDMKQWAFKRAFDSIQYCMDVLNPPEPPDPAKRYKFIKEMWFTPAQIKTILSQLIEE